MEGAVPLLAAVIALPVFAGIAGVFLLRRHRNAGTVLLAIMVLVLGMLAAFVLG